jgi:hypothetical protein
VSATLGLSFLGVLLLWVVSRRFKSEPRDAIFWAISLGVLLTLTLWAILRPSFSEVSRYPLGWGNFLYSGFLAGAVTGEIRHRSLARDSPISRSAAELKMDLYIAALMTWAVILKVRECFELITVQPGREFFAPHPFLFLSVLLWTPLVCKYLWKYTPSRAIYAVLWASASGLLLPLLSGFILGYPGLILLYMGVPVVYEMAWGVQFLYALDLRTRVLSLSPGVTWGLIVGFLRWRYLPLEKQSSPDTVPSRLSSP